MIGHLFAGERTDKEILLCQCIPVLVCRSESFFNLQFDYKGFSRILRRHSYIILIPGGLDNLQFLSVR